MDEPRTPYEQIEAAQERVKQVQHALLSLPRDERTEQMWVWIAAACEVLLLAHQYLDRALMAEEAARPYPPIPEETR